VQAGTCQINGRCYEDGDWKADSNDNCLKCRPEYNTSSWALGKSHLLLYM